MPRTARSISCVTDIRDKNEFEGEIVKFIPLGIVGAAVGAVIMKKLSNSLLKRIFGALMIIAGVRIFMK